MSNISTDSFLLAMENLLNDRSDENCTNFEKELAQTEFLSPVCITNKNATDDLNTSDVSFINITDGDNNIFLLAFTDSEKFDKFKKDNPFTPIKATVKDFEYILTNVEKDAKGVVINIGDEAVFIPKDKFIN